MFRVRSGDDSAQGRVLCAIKDEKANAFLPVFEAETREVAIRIFSNACRDTDHQFNINAADFHLFELAEYDRGNGKIKPHEARVHLGCAQEFKIAGQAIARREADAATKGGE